MSPETLKKKLENSLETFRQETIFMTETHDGDYLDKDDLEAISRQVFYVLNDFQKIIIQYARELNR